MNHKFAALLIAIAAMVIVLLFLFLPSPPESAAPTTAPGPASSKPPPVNYSANLDASVTVTAPSAVAPAPEMPSAVPWEDKLDALLTSDTDIATTVRGLVTSMRGLPTEAQEEFVAHAVNLCEDDQYEMLARIYLDPKTPKAVSETIFNDALNRPDEIKLPLLANTLRNATHPMTAEAKEILEAYLDLEPGTVPPSGWEQAVAAYIRAQGE